MRILLPSYLFITLHIALFRLEEISNNSETNIFYSITKKKIEELFQRNPYLKASKYLSHYYNSSFPITHGQIAQIGDEELNKKRIAEAFDHLISYSSRNRNDLSSYYECVKTNKLNRNNYTYLIMQYDSQGKETYYPKTITFGLCMVEDASFNNNDPAAFTNELKELISQTNEQSGYLMMPKDASFTLINVNEFMNINNEWYEILVLCLSFLFLAGLFLFTLFNMIPEFLFKCCFKKPISHSETEKKEDVNKNKLFSFVSCFNWSENSEELFGNNLNTAIYNDTGLSYAKGVNSICLILFIFGLTYMRLFQSSTVMFQENKYKSTLRNILFPFFSFGVRFCPRIMFSLSGFTFIYKILCFFEDESLNQEERNDGLSRKNKSSRTKSKDNDKTHENNKEENKNNQTLDALINKGILLEKNSLNSSQIRITSLIIFILKQVHKYINAFVTILLFPTISILIKLFSGFCSSLTILYKEILGKLEFEDIFGHFFVYKSFYVFEGHLAQEKHDHCCMRFIWMFINEFFFFFISSPIIFLCCKFQIALNRVILSLFILFLIFRYIIYYLLIHSQVNLYEKASNFLLDYSSFNSFAMNPLFNYPCFLIGIFFGLMNYVLQKDISDSSLFSLSSTIVSYFKYQSKILLYLGVILIIGLISVIVYLQQLFYVAVSNNDSDFYSNEGINGFYLMDIEIVIVLIHLLLFSLYAKGGNSLTRILSHKTWIKFNKIYSSVIISVNMYLLLIIHQSETKVGLEIFSFLFYGIIIFAVMLLCAYFNCIAYEFPMKRLLKLITSEARKSE